MPREFKKKQENLEWWKQSKNAYETIFNAVSFLDKNQSWRSVSNLQNLRLYGDYKNAGLNTSLYSRQNTDSGPLRTNLSFNVVKANCDTATALIAKQNVKVTFLTDGGNWSQQRRAKGLEKFVSGLFYQTKSHSKMKKGFLHSTIFGTGATKVYRQGDSIQVEPVFIDELKVDEAEAIYGNPLQLFQVRRVSKSRMKASFPEHADIIEDAELIADASDTTLNLADMITVVEAWRLPSGKDANDGRRVLCVSSGDLINEEYEKDHFPFIFHRWGDRVLGFFSQGIAEQLTGNQYEINSLLKTIQKAMRLCSVPKVFLEIGSKVNTAQINNEIGGIIPYSGRPPIYQGIEAVPEQLFRQVETLIRRSFEITGVSQLSASAKKPSGLDSGVALREYKDIENERFALNQQAYEENYLTLAGYMIELAAEIHEEYGEFEVTAEANKELDRIKWSDISLNKEAYQMKLYPSSSLPNTPAGRLDKSIELYQAGLFSKEEISALLDFPDLKAVTNRINADYNSIQMIIEHMLDKGKYIPPEPYQNIKLGVVEVQRAYLEAKMNGAPEDRLNLLRRWISQAQSMAEKFAKPPAPMPMDSGMGAPVPGGPIARPEPMPTSQLVPQV